VNGRSVAKRSFSRPPVRHNADDTVALAAEPETELPQADGNQRPKVLELAGTRGVGSGARGSRKVNAATVKQPLPCSRIDARTRERPPPRGLTIAQLAELWHVSDRTIHRLVKAGELPAFRIGNRVRISEEDARAFALRNQV
jgi:excisionase family DNA binding protein